MDREFNITMAVVGILAIIIGKRIMDRSSKEAVLQAAREFIPAQEGFSATPYWDVHRWSWGYGTPAPQSSGKISRDEAAAEMMNKFVIPNYDYLRGLVTTPLSATQWAAFLSFSYNLGLGNAKNLVENINRSDYDALGTQWKKYIYAGGVVSDVLVDRRQREWDLFVS